MATSIEQRETQLGFGTENNLLGALLGPYRTSISVDEDGNQHTTRVGVYEYARLVEEDGDAWLHAEATVADRFLPSPP